jgi:hypothetical protein
MSPPAVSLEQWDHLVWYACAIHDDGRAPPAFAPMGRAGGATAQAAKIAWYDGLPHLGKPSIKSIRREISAGTRPWPVQPPGAAPAVSRLAKLVSKAATKAPAPSPRARPRGGDEAEPDPWGGSLPDDVAGALGDVPFPDEVPAPPQVPLNPRRLPPGAHAAGRQAVYEAARDRIELDPAMAALIEQAAVLLAEDPGTYSDDTPPLPSDAARAAGVPASPIDRARVDQALLESRLDAIDLATRARRGAALGVYASQLIMSGAVPLAKRVRREALLLARQVEKVDLMEAMTFLDRATRVARSVSTVASNVMAFNKHVTDDLRVLAKVLDGAAPAGSGEDGELTDEELAAQMQAEEERLARDRRRLERQMAGGPPTPPQPGGEAGASQSAPSKVSLGGAAETIRQKHIDGSSLDTDGEEGAASEEAPAENQENGDDGAAASGDDGGGRNDG